jgi:hypothetical protein
MPTFDESLMEYHNARATFRELRSALAHAETLVGDALKARDDVYRRLGSARTKLVNAAGKLAPELAKEIRSDLGPLASPPTPAAEVGTEQVTDPLIVKAESNGG